MTTGCTSSRSVCIDFVATPTSASGITLCGDADHGVATIKIMVLNAKNALKDRKERHN